MGEVADTQGARRVSDCYSDSTARHLCGDLALIACPAMLSEWHRTKLLPLRLTERNDDYDGSTLACVRSTRPNHGTLTLELVGTSLVRERAS